MAFAEWIKQAGGEDFLRSLVETVLTRLMDYEVSGIAGAGLHERSGERQAYRNGYRERTLDSRLGTLDLRIRSFAAAATSRPSWSREGSRRRPLRRRYKKHGLGACPRARWTTWCKL